MFLERRRNGIMVVISASDLLPTMVSSMKWPLKTGMSCFFFSRTVSHIYAVIQTSHERRLPSSRKGVRERNQGKAKVRETRSI